MACQWSYQQGSIVCPVTIILTHFDNEKPKSSFPLLLHYAFHCCCSSSGLLHHSGNCNLITIIIMAIVILSTYEQLHNISNHILISS